MIKLTPLFWALMLSAMANMTACQKTPEPPSDMSDIKLQAPINLSELPTPSSDKEAELMRDMVWVLSADPITDAQSSLASGAPELIAFSTRFTSYPGLDADEHDAIATRTGDIYPPGSSDVIYGEGHSILRRALNDYAKSYNRAIYAGLTTP